MGSKVCAHVLNTIYAILGFGMAAAGIWFFVEVREVTNLRNANHYLLNYTPYWPQVVPWLYIMVGILAMSVSACGFSGTSTRSKTVLRVHVTFVSITILISIAVAVIALVFADSKHSDEFYKDTIWDAFNEMKEHHEVETAFGRIERRLQCCGSQGPRDYVNWKDDFPISCCDVFYHGWLEPYSIFCEKTNKLANERHGCATVAAQYSRIIIKVLSGISILIGFIGIFLMVASIRQLRSLLQRPRVLQARQESESKKGLI